MKRHIIPLTAVLLSFSVVGWAQDGSSHTVPIPAISPGVPYTTELTPPLPVTTVQRPLTFSSETERGNYITGRLQVGAGYDDNILVQPSHHVDDVSYMVTPSIEIGQTRERWDWDFGYSPGFVINQRVFERNQAAHNLHLLFDYRLSPHVTAQVHEGFERTNSLFSGLTGPPEIGPGPLQKPNTSGVTPFANRTANTSGLDLTYQFGVGSLVGASGNYNFVNYDAPAGLISTNYGLADTRAWGGDGFYAHRFSNQHWAGLSYDFQRLQFDYGNRTDVNRTLLFYTVPVSSQLTLSLWTGPEYTLSTVPSLATHGSKSTGSEEHWGVAGGADLSWQGKRTSTRLEYTRQASDGSGLAQAVKLEQVEGEIRERLTRRWTLDAGVGYARNTPLNAVSGPTPYRSWVGNAGLQYKLTDNLAFDARYGRDQLQYENRLPPVSWSNRNRAWVSMSYSFSRPLGR